MESIQKRILYQAGYFDSDISFPNLTYSPQRVVSAYELEFFAEDCVTYLDGKEYRLSAGSVFRASPGMVRYSRLPFRNHYLKFPEEEYAFCTFIRAMPHVYQSAFYDTYRACFAEIMTGQVQHNPWRAAAGLFSLFSSLQEEQSIRGGAPSGIDKRMDVAMTAISYMKEHLAQPCTLNDLAAAVHLSPVYFHTVFKQTQKETPLACLTRLRLDRAKVLLLTSSHSPRLISELCGFSSEAYFTAVFKKANSMTPRQYRKKMMDEYFDLHEKKFE